MKIKLSMNIIIGHKIKDNYFGKREIRIDCKIFSIKYLLFVTLFDEAWIKYNWKMHSLTILVERSCYSKKLASNRFYDNYSLKYVFVTKLTILRWFSFYFCWFFLKFLSFNIFNYEYLLFVNWKRKKEKKKIMKIMKWDIKNKIICNEDIACSMYIFNSNKYVCVFFHYFASTR